MQFDTQRLTIRPMLADDLDDVLIYALDPVVNVLGPFPTDRDFAINRFKQSLEPWQGQNNEKLVLAIANKATAAVVGEMMFKYASKPCGLVEIGYCLNAAAQGQGFASEAVKGMIQHAFAQYDVHKIMAQVDVRNDASNKLLAKLGLRREGCLIEHSKFNDNWCDMVIWGGLAQDFNFVD